MLAVGLVAPVVCIIWWRRLRVVDHSVAVRTEAITTLRRVAMLRLLPVPVIEELAHAMPAGTGFGEIALLGESLAP